MDNERPSTGYCTKYACTQGIYQLTGHVGTVGDTLYFAEGKNTIAGGHFLKVGVDFFEDFEEARANAKKKILAKIRSHEKAIKVLNQKLLDL